MRVTIILCLQVHIVVYIRWLAVCMDCIYWRISISHSVYITGDGLSWLPYNGVDISPLYEYYVFTIVLYAGINACTNPSI